MFCPRCGVALSQAIEVCSGCGADLRPLAETGFFTSLQSSATHGRSEPEEETLPGSGPQAGPDDITQLTPAPFSISASDDDTVESPLGIIDSDETAAAGIAMPGGGYAPDATRLLAPGAAYSGDRDVRRPTPPPKAPSSGHGTRRPRTGGAASSEGPLQVGDFLGNR